MPEVTWRDVMAEARAQLPGDEAWFVGEEASGWDRAELVRRLDEVAPDRLVAYARSMVDRRAAGEPLQYVLGRWGFRGLDLLVDRRVLIPRPETETVVDVVLAELRRLFSAAGERPPARRSSSTWAPAPAPSHWPWRPRSRTPWCGPPTSPTTRSPSPAPTWPAPGAPWDRGCAWPRAGGTRRCPTRSQGRVDLIVSNPPYVAEGEELPAEVADWEPRDALVAGTTGLEAIDEVVAGAAGWLTRPGALVVELAPHQAEAAAEALAAPDSSTSRCATTSPGRPRVLVARAIG